MNAIADEMRYDCSANFAAAIANGTAVCGKGYERALNDATVRLAPNDVRAAFPTSEAVNAAFREVTEIAK